MKNRVLLTALSVGVLGMGTAYAHAMPDSDAVFKKLDSNGDNQLSAAELQKMPQVMHQMRFAQADTDSDGKIGKDEFMARANDRAQHMFQHMDKNSDGAITQGEMASAHHGHAHKGKWHKGDRKGGHRGAKHDMMGKMDADANGSVSKSEWDSTMAKFHRHHASDDADKS